MDYEQLQQCHSHQKLYIFFINEFGGRVKACFICWISVHVDILSYSTTVIIIFHHRKTLFLISPYFCLAGNFYSVLPEATMTSWHHGHVQDVDLSISVELYSVGLQQKLFKQLTIHAMVRYIIIVILHVYI